MKLGDEGVQLSRSSSAAYLVMMKVNIILIVFFVGSIPHVVNLNSSGYFQGHHSRILLRRKKGWTKKRMLTLARKMKWPTLLLMKKKLTNMVLLLGIAFEIYMDVGWS